MNPAVVDTDVISILFKRGARSDLYLSYLTNRLLGISFMTFAELERWPLERNWGLTRTMELQSYLVQYTVLPVSRELCSLWARVSVEARRKGRPIQAADAWVAATALHYRVPLVTNNPSDYNMLAGLTVISGN